MWRNWVILTLLVRVWDDIAAMENSLAVPFKTKNDCQYDPGSCTLEYISQRNKKHFHSETCARIFLGALFMLTKMHTTQMSFSGT